MAKAEEAVRVMFVVDTTGSMGQYCTSLSDTLPQVFTVLKVLFAGRAQVDVIAYEDYCDGERLCRFCYGGEAEATAFAQTLRAGGGGDYPEASKTALHEAVRRMGDSGGGGGGSAAAAGPPPLILFYTDAPPHTAQTGGANHAAESKALAGVAPGFDWLDICRRVRAEGAQVHTFVPPQAQETVVRHHALLGAVVELPDTQPATITAATMGVVLQAMGQEFGGRAAFEGRVVAGVEEGSLEGLTEAADGGHLWAAQAPPAVKELVTMGFSQGMAAAALRLARGAVDQAVELLLGGGVSEGGDAAGRLVPLRRGGLDVEALRGWGRDLSGLPPRFAGSEGFRETVFAALRTLIDPARPQRVLALTYNRVLGLLWRLACRRREDARMEGLGEALGRCVLALEGEQQAQLRAWVDESYDRSEEATELIRSAGAGGGALVLDAAAAGVALPSKEDMRSLVHAPTPAVLAAVQRLLTTVVRVDGAAAAAEGTLPERDGVPQWVPCTLGGAELFGLLPHLALPGLMVTLRPACVMAILAYLSGNAHLAERAEALLTQAKGRWIPAVAKVEEYPEVLSAGFVRLVARVPQFLTEEEVGVYVRAARVLDARAASALRVEVVCGFRPRKGALFADEKAVCGSCGVRRSLSLLQDGTCGLCRNPTVGAAVARGCLEPADDRSHLVECRRCASLYAVVRLAALNVEPKCYYCRRGDASPPTVQCVRCANRYVRPGAADGATFTCGECGGGGGGGGAATQREEAEVAALESANPGALLGPLGFAAEAAGALWSSMSLFKLWARHPELFVEGQAAAAAGAASLRWRGRKVLNADEAVATAVDRVARGDLSGVCNLCFEDCPVVALESACGRCDNVACARCLKKWYASLQPGRLYTPTLALCPFCKRRPLGATLKKYNAAACGIVTSRKHGVAEATLRADMLYGWCVRCYRVREALPKVCGARVEGTPLEGFCCEECAEAGDPEARQCPRCVAPTYKVDGCNHISCPCGCEWCWECSEDCTDGVVDVYDHMMQEHGGIM